MLELLAFSPPGWGGALLAGALVTLQIAALSYLVGMLLGLAGAAAKLGGNPALFWLAEAYTTLIRAVPELLLIILLYYAGSSGISALFATIGLDVEISGFAAAVGVLGIVSGAYQTEVIRGAILAIPRGQMEAARAYGMPPFLRLRRVTIPSMLPVALPGLANLWLILLKDTALISVVGFSELLYVGKQAAGSSKQYLLFYLAVGGIYLTMTLASNVVFRVLERHVRRGVPAV